MPVFPFFSPKKNFDRGVLLRNFVFIPRLFFFFLSLLSLRFSLLACVWLGWVAFSLLSRHFWLRGHGLGVFFLSSECWHFCHCVGVYLDCYHGCYTVAAIGRLYNGRLCSGRLYHCWVAVIGRLYQCIDSVYSCSYKMTDCIITGPLQLPVSFPT